MKKRKLKRWVKVTLRIIAIIMVLLVRAKISHLTRVGVVEYNYTIDYKTPHHELKNTDTMKDYRLTSYYTGDFTGSGKCTASGICTDKFQTNEKGWYTYKGKLVVATANKNYIKLSKYEYNDKITYRTLYDEIIIIIDNVEYEAIVLDICGYAHKEPRIDLFVSSKEYLKDTNIKVID